MGLSLLQIWLLGCFFCYAFTSMVNRRKDYDKITPNSCVKTCQHHNAYCTKQRATCCKECRCIDVAKTFYRKNSTQACVVNPNREEGCKYYLHGKTSIQLKRVYQMNLGLLNHQEVKLFSYKCTITNKQYWNLLEWEDFDDDEKSFEIYKETDHFIRLNIRGKNTSLYEGYLIKLEIDCINAEKEDSCIIFKILGKRKYDANTETGIIKPTQKPKTPTTTIPLKKKKRFLIIVVIAVSAAILLVVVAITLWWCWKKRRKESGKGNGEREILNYGEDPNYQNSDRFSVRHSTEMNSSANNLTYLQPVDAGLPNNSSRHTQGNNHQKKKKDPNYDYPDIKSLSKKSNYQLTCDDSREKPIYAEVCELKPDPEYTNPDSFIKPRSVTEVVGVPGYQPPRGPFCDDSKSEYSSLGVTSADDDNSAYQSLLSDNDSKKKPPSPQYAIVEPEESSEITI